MDPIYSQELQELQEYANEFTKKFAENLVALCNENIEAKNQLAKELGTTPQTISHYIARKSLPKLDTLIMIAKHFEVSLDELVGLPTKPKKQNQQFFSDKTGLSISAINKLYNYKRWKTHDKDLTALNFLIGYNDFTDDNNTLLRYLYDAIYHRPRKIDITDKKNSTYYNDNYFFLEPYLTEGMFVPMSDVYLMLFYKKIEHIVKNKIWDLNDVQETTEKLLEQKNEVKEERKKKQK